MENIAVLTHITAFGLGGCFAWLVALIQRDRAKSKPIFVSADEQKLLEAVAHWNEIKGYR